MLKCHGTCDDNIYDINVLNKGFKELSGWIRGNI